MAMRFNQKRMIKTLSDLQRTLKSIFFRKSKVSEKTEMNFKALRTAVFTFIFIYIATVMLMPEEQTVEFSEKIIANEAISKDSPQDQIDNSNPSQDLWNAPRPASPGARSDGLQVNHNTSMILGSKAGNAKVQLRSGTRLPLRIMDKFIVSNEPVPVLAELLFDAATDSGLRLPAGTKFYGEASFQKGAERAEIQFRQVSLPDGQIRSMSGIAMGKDGQPGIPGRIHSDGLKNTAGSVLTTFVGGLAAGSVETDFMGRSRGGLENGLLSAVAATARERAQAYGEKMKAEREWIEVSAETECDALLSESMNLQRESSE